MFDTEGNKVVLSKIDELELAKAEDELRLARLLETVDPGVVLLDAAGKGVAEANKDALSAISMLDLAAAEDETLVKELFIVNDRESNTDDESCTDDIDRTTDLLGSSDKLDLDDANNDVLFLDKLLETITCDSTGGDGCNAKDTEEDNLAVLSDTARDELTATDDGVLIAKLLEKILEIDTSTGDDTIEEDTGLNAELPYVISELELVTTVVELLPTGLLAIANVSVASDDVNRKDPTEDKVAWSIATLELTDRGNALLLAELRRLSDASCTTKDDSISDDTDDDKNELSSTDTVELTARYDEPLIPLLLDTNLCDDSPEDGITTGDAEVTLVVDSPIATDEMTPSDDWPSSVKLLATMALLEDTLGDDRIVDDTEGNKVVLSKIDELELAKAEDELRLARLLETVDPGVVLLDAAGKGVAEANKDALSAISMLDLAAAEDETLVKELFIVNDRESNTDDESCTDDIDRTTDLLGSSDKLDLDDANNDVLFLDKLLETITCDSTGGDGCNAKDTEEDNLAVLSDTARDELTATDDGVLIAKLLEKILEIDTSTGDDTIEEDTGLNAELPYVISELELVTTVVELLPTGLLAIANVSVASDDVNRKDPTEDKVAWSIATLELTDRGNALLLAELRRLSDASCTTKDDSISDDTDDDNNELSSTDTVELTARYDEPLIPLLLDTNLCDDSPEDGITTGDAEVTLVVDSPIATDEMTPSDDWPSSVKLLATMALLEDTLGDDRIVDDTEGNKVVLSKIDELELAKAEDELRLARLLETVDPGVVLLDAAGKGVAEANKDALSAISMLDLAAAEDETLVKELFIVNDRESNTDDESCTDDIDRTTDLLGSSDKLDLDDANNDVLFLDKLLETITCDSTGGDGCNAKDTEEDNLAVLSDTARDELTATDDGVLIAKLLEKILEIDTSTGDDTIEEDTGLNAELPYVISELELVTTVVELLPTGLLAIANVSVASDDVNRKDPTEDKVAWSIATLELTDRGNALLLAELRRLSDASCTTKDDSISDDTDDDKNELSSTDTVELTARYDEPLIPLLLDTNLCDDSPEDGITTGDAEVTLVVDSPIATDEMTPSDDWPSSVKLLATMALLEDTLGDDRIVDDTEGNKVVLSKIDELELAKAEDELRLARLLETVDPGVVLLDAAGKGVAEANKDALSAISMLDLAAAEDETLVKELFIVNDRESNTDDESCTDDIDRTTDLLGSSDKLDLDDANNDVLFLDKLLETITCDSTGGDGCNAKDTEEDNLAVLSDTARDELTATDDGVLIAKLLEKILEIDTSTGDDTIEEDTGLNAELPYVISELELVTTVVELLPTGLLAIANVSVASDDVNRKDPTEDKVAWSIATLELTDRGNALLLAELRRLSDASCTTKDDSISDDTDDDKNELSSTDTVELTARYDEPLIPLLLDTNLCDDSPEDGITTGDAEVTLVVDSPIATDEMTPSDDWPSSVKLLATMALLEDTLGDDRIVDDTEGNKVVLSKIDELELAKAEDELRLARLLETVDPGVVLLDAAGKGVAEANKDALSAISMLDLAAAEDETLVKELFIVNDRESNTDDESCTDDIDRTTDLLGSSDKLDLDDANNDVLFLDKLLETITCDSTGGDGCNAKDTEEDNLAVLSDTARDELTATDDGVLIAKLLEKILEIDTSTGDDTIEEDTGLNAELPYVISELELVTTVVELLPTGLLAIANVSVASDDVNRKDPTEDKVAWSIATLELTDRGNALLLAELRRLSDASCTTKDDSISDDTDDDKNELSSTDTVELTARYDEPLIPLLLDTNLCDDSPEDGITTGDAEVTLVVDSPIATDEMTPSDDWPSSVKLLATMALLEDTLGDDRIVDDTEGNKVVLSKIDELELAKAEDELRLARLLETVDPGVVLLDAAGKGVAEANKDALSAISMLDLAAAEDETLVKELFIVNDRESNTDDESCTDDIDRTTDLLGSSDKLDLDDANNDVLFLDKLLETITCDSTGGDGCNAKDTEEDNLAVLSDTARDELTATDDGVLIAKLLEKILEIDTSTGDDTIEEDTGLNAELPYVISELELVTTVVELLPTGLLAIANVSVASDDVNRKDPTEDKVAWSIATLELTDRGNALLLAELRRLSDASCTTKDDSISDDTDDDKNELSSTDTVELTARYDEPLIPLLLDTNLCDDSPEDGITTGDAEVTLVVDSPIATDEMTPSDDWPSSVKLLATMALLEDTLGDDRIVDDTEGNKVVLSKIDELELAKAEDELRLARLLETVDPGVVLLDAAGKGVAEANKDALSAISMLDLAAAEDETLVKELFIVNDRESNTDDESCTDDIDRTTDLLGSSDKLDLDDANNDVLFLDKLLETITCDSTGGDGCNAKDTEEDNLAVLSDTARDELTATDDGVLIAKLLEKILEIDTSTGDDTIEEDTGLNAELPYVISELELVPEGYLQLLMWAIPLKTRWLELLPHLSSLAEEMHYFSLSFQIVRCFLYTKDDSICRWQITDAEWTELHRHSRADRQVRRTTHSTAAWH